MALREMEIFGWRLRDFRLFFQWPRRAGLSRVSLPGGSGTALEAELCHQGLRLLDPAVLRKVLTVLAVLAV